MKKFFIGIVLLAGLAVITNPNEAKHKEAVKRELNNSLEEEFGKVGEMLSTDFKLKNKAIGTLIERENLYVFSKTKLKVLGEEKVIGYGFFGFVMIDRSAFQN